MAIVKPTGAIFSPKELGCRCAMCMAGETVGSSLPAWSLLPADSEGYPADFERHKAPTVTDYQCPRCLHRFFSSAPEGGGDPYPVCSDCGYGGEKLLTAADERKRKADADFADFIRSMMDKWASPRPPGSYAFKKFGSARPPGQPSDHADQEPWLDAGSTLTELQTAWFTAWDSEWWRQANMNRWIEATNLTVSAEGATGNALLVARRALDIAETFVVIPPSAPGLAGELESARLQIRAALQRSGTIPTPLEPSGQ